MRKDNRGRPGYQVLSGASFTDIDRRTLIFPSQRGTGGMLPPLSGNVNDVLNGKGEWMSMQQMEELLERLLVELKLIKLHLGKLSDEELKTEDINAD